MKPRTTFELMQRILGSGKETFVTQSVQDEVMKETGFDASEFAGVAITPDLPKEKPANVKDAVLGCLTLDPGEEPRLPDNLTSDCSWGCGRTVQYRPTAPEWLPRVCLYCIDERPKENNS